MKKYDFLIIGGGVAGMSFALKVARTQKYRIALCCKTTLDETNTSRVDRHKEEGPTQCQTRFTISAKLRIVRNVHKGREKPQHGEKGDIDQIYIQMNVNQTIHSLKFSKYSLAVIAKRHTKVLLFLCVRENGVYFFCVCMNFP